MNEDLNKEQIDISRDIALINRFTRIEISPDEVYCFPLVLCDNKTDRDGERFSLRALEKLSELFVGRTGIFDHQASGKNQTARIYFCEVRKSEEKTAEGEDYTYLFAKAYMLRSKKNSELIREIDGGIKKEVSVSCSVKRKICSVCKRDITKNPCAHRKGEMYKGKRCAVILDEPYDAYEWSFVAVPAQKNAGVKKNYELNVQSEPAEESHKNADLANEVSRLLYLSDTVLPFAVIKELLCGADEKRLLSIREELKRNLSKRPVLQITSRLKNKNNHQYQL